MKLETVQPFDGKDTFDNEEINNKELILENKNFFLESFNDYINQNIDVYILSDSWSFDPDNCLIIAPQKYFILKKREVIFLKMLLKSKKIVTYEEMKKMMWKTQEEISLNAIRLFIRDMKKKLPSKALRNYQGIGYKLSF